MSLKVEKEKEREKREKALRALFETMAKRSVNKLTRVDRGSPWKRGGGAHKVAESLAKEIQRLRSGLVHFSRVVNKRHRIYNVHKVNERKRNGIKAKRENADSREQGDRGRDY